MILRHSREPIDGQPTENTFVAIDERSGELLGSAVIYVEEKPVMYPIRPLQVCLQLDRTPVPDALMGAAVARAKDICVRSGKFCRIFARVAPEDSEALSALTTMGFIDNDGLIRMQMRLPTERDFPRPENAEIVYDDLSDSLEQKYFLERYNRLYSTDHNADWLADYIDRRSFQRILLLSDNGVMAEALTWREGYAGIIGYFQTMKRWRRMGAGKYLISLACDRFEQQNLYCAEANIRARFPHALKLMQSVGFSQAELLMRYPGIDVNPREVN